MTEASPAVSLAAVTPTHPTDPVQVRLAQLETLSSLLGRAQAVEASLPDVLQFIMQITSRPGGLIFLRPPLDWTAHHSPPSLWLAQIVDPASALRQLIDQLLDGHSAASHPPSNLSLAAIIPIATANASVGVLLLSGEPCSPEEIDWLSYLGRFLGRAIERHQVFAATEDRSQELAALHKIASTLTSTLQLDEILSGTTDGIRQVLNVEAASLLLLDETHGELVFKKTLGGNPDWIFQYSLKVGSGLVGEAVRTKQPVLINDVKADPRFYPDLDSLAGLETRTLLCAPLITRGQTLGAMAVINKRDGPFNQHDQELLESMTASVANAIYNARLFHQLTVANADLEASRWEVIRSRSTLQALFDGIPNPIYIVDRDYRLVAVNLASASRAKIMVPVDPAHSPAPADDPADEGEPGLKARENERHALLGHACYQTLFGQTQPCTGCRMAETLATGQSTQRAERRWDTDGQPIEWEISTYPIFDEKGQTLQVILLNQDVTEKHRLETSLAQSEKMAAVGQLAAGVAHEINNPLAAIIANTQLLQRDLPADDERQESLELIGKAGDRALRVVRNLLDFARQDRYEFSATDVSDTLQTALDLIEHQLRTHSIVLHCSLAPDLPLIQASHDHLQSVWLNLLLNARDAFAGQGGEIWLTAVRQGEEVRVTVTDNGMGIPPEKLSKIFEPFYTTKLVGQGTGLGLSLCQRIVKQHGGRILVDSRVGQGTVFTVVLPITPPSPI
jgi:two-component system, NtrC family, sensor kinase